MKVDDRAFYWLEDFSRSRPMVPRLVFGSKARFFSIEGSTVALDLGSRIVKVNISKVPMDETIPPDKPRIHIPELNQRATKKAPAAFAEDTLEDGTGPSNCYWKGEAAGMIFFSISGFAQLNR